MARQECDYYDDVSINAFTPSIGTNYGSYTIQMGKIQIVNFIVDVGIVSANTVLATGLGTAQKNVYVQFGNTGNNIHIGTNGTAVIQYATSAAISIRVQAIRVLT